MSKIVLSQPAGGFNLAAINSNFQKIQDEFNNKVLYRANPFGESNQMYNNLDMNGQHLINLPAPYNVNEAARLKDVQNAISGAKSANLISFDPYETLTATTVQEAVQQVFDETQQVYNESTHILSPEQNGAAADGATDDTLAMQTYLNTLSAAGGGTVVLMKKYYFASTLTVPKNIRLMGIRGNPGVARSAISYDNTNGLILLGAGATLSMGDSSSIDGVTILTSVLKGALPFANSTVATAAVAAFAGTGITLAGDDIDIRNCLILGFNTAVYGVGRQRITTDNLKIDCTNGIDIQTTADVCKVSRCHCWPFLTGYLSFAGGTALVTRSGFAFRYSNVADWSEHFMCSSYGFFNGFIYDSVNAVLNVAGAADYPSGMAVNGAGFSALNTTTNLTLIAPRSEGQSYGVFVNTTNANTTTGTAVTIHNGKFWTLGLAGVRVQAGRAIIQNNEFYNVVASGSQGVSLGPNSIVNGPCIVTGNDFDAVTTPFGVDAAGIGFHSIENNYLRNSSDGVIGEIKVFNNTVPTKFTYNYSTSTTGYSNRNRKARGTYSAPTIAVAADNIGLWQMDAYDGSSYQPAAMLRGAVGATISTGVMTGRIIFSINKGSTSLTDTLILDETGALKGVTDNAYDLGSASLRYRTVYAATGTINTSDANTKTDITDATLGSAFIDSLRPVSYKFKVGRTEVVNQVYRNSNGDVCDPSAVDAQPAEILTEDIPGVRTHWGLIAQEVKQSADSAGVDFGGWTLADKDDPNSQQGLRYDQFVAPLIKASQEDRIRIKALEDQVAALTAKLSQ